MPKKQSVVLWNWRKSVYVKEATEHPKAYFSRENDTFNFKQISKTLPPASESKVGIVTKYKERELPDHPHFINEWLTSLY